MQTEQTPSAPLVSVVSASYNALEGVRRTVESVAAQGEVSVEHIVIDGGSDDGTREYLEAQGDKVHWISEPDEGIGDALNKGVAMARGDYVLVLQAGDTFASDDALQMAAPHLATGTDIVSFDVLLVDGQRQTLLRSEGFGLRFAFFMSMPHQGALCRRELFERCGVFDPSFSVTMDYDFYFRARAEGAKALVVNRVLALMPEDGISTQKDWPSQKKRIGEARSLHFRYARSPLERAAYGLFWALYWPYKRMKNRIAP